MPRMKKLNKAQEVRDTDVDAYIANGWALIDAQPEPAQEEPEEKPAPRRRSPAKPKAGGEE